VSAARAIALLVVLGSLAKAQPPEPPPEAGDGDYTLEAADSLADEELEVAVGAASRGGADFRRSQRVSFRGGGTRGTLRDGDDALNGGRVEAPFACGSLAAGRLAPRWGRGLVLGGASEPWVFTAEDRGAGAAYRGRSGSGLAYESARVTLVGGRFGRRRIAGARAIAGDAALGVLAGDGPAQASAALEQAGRALELAFDARGRWRAEAALADDTGPTRIALRARGGLFAFRPLAEPARAGPPRALAATASREWSAASVHALGALWSWRAGGPAAASGPGARASLAIDVRVGPRAAVALGAEEQHGARREPSPRVRAAGTRQGWWCEWRGGSPAARLSLRHELWGSRAFARDAVRRAVVARADWAVPFGGRFVLTQAAWRVRSGESLYLPEIGPDRLVLRASSGTGTRTRAELRLPLAAGSLRFGATLAAGGTRAGTKPPAWNVEWSRRSHLASRGTR